MKNRFINDTIYSHIEYTGLEGNILQTKILSRLQFITQNALAYFAFPSINTKRYIHSLGTMHVASHMYKSALLNAKSDIRSKILNALYEALKRIEKEHGIDIKTEKSIMFEDDSLYQFLIPLKNSKEKYSYLLSLQALRLAGLLHDVGHLPFSHQVEYALQDLYNEHSLAENPNEKQKDFIYFYEKVTKKNSKILHEAMGIKFLDMLFEYEIAQSFSKKVDKNYIKIIHSLVSNILQDAARYGFDFGVLHSFIDSTVDADRLDYVNRDMLSSGYIGGAVDLLRIAKQSVLTTIKEGYYVSFFDSAVLDIEHMLEMRFNLYKKVIFNHQIAKKDAMLENLILHLSNDYFLKQDYKRSSDISMLWKFLDEKNIDKRLDTITLLDENWLISLFKEEYFHLKYSKEQKEYKTLMIFEEVLFGKKYFNSIWKNLNDLYNVLDFNTTQRYRFRESFGYISLSKSKILKESLDGLVSYYESKKEGLFLSYQIVSFNLGVSKNFYLLGLNDLVALDEVSTLRKRLKKSMLNTVPFFIYCNKETLDEDMKRDLKELLISVFEKDKKFNVI